MPMKLKLKIDTLIYNLKQKIFLNVLAKLGTSGTVGIYTK